MQLNPISFTATQGEQVPDLEDLTKTALIRLILEERETYLLLEKEVIVLMEIYQKSPR